MLDWWKRSVCVIGTEANFTMKMLAESFNMSKNTVWIIIAEDVGKRKHELN